MESKVEMTLEEYTNIITENTRLKCMLHDCKRQAFNMLKSNVKEYSINKLTKDECEKTLTMELRKIIGLFGYEFTTKSACEEFPCFSRDEIEKMYGDIIRNRIQVRIEDLEGA